MQSKTMGWEFEYHLSDRIDCENKIPKRPDIQFITEIYGKHSQHAITGFKIISHNPVKNESEAETNQKALRLTELLTSSSGTHSRCSMRGSKEITKSGGGRVLSLHTFSYAIRNNAVLSMNDKKFSNHPNFRI